MGITDIKRPDRGAESLASAIADVLNKGYKQRQAQYFQTLAYAQAIKELQHEYKLKAAEEGRKRKFEASQRKMDREAAYERAKMYSGATKYAADVGAGARAKIPLDYRMADMYQDGLASTQRLLASPNTLIWGMTNPNFLQGLMDQESFYKTLYLKSVSNLLKDSPAGKKVDKMLEGFGVPKPEEPEEDEFSKHKRK